MFAEVLYLAELPVREGKKTPVAVVRPYGPLIKELFTVSNTVLQACTPRTDEQVQVVPLTSIASVVGIFQLAIAPPGWIFAGEKMGLRPDYFMGPQ
jgi:hypothetical protein